MPLDALPPAAPKPWLLASKLVPPALPAGHLPRERLAPEGPLPPLTVIAAGPGYGKTRTLAALASHALPPGGLVLWLALDALDADVATFFHYLLAGMRRHIPDFGPELEAMLAAGAADPVQLWRGFVQLVEAYNLATLRIALDDCHHLSAAPLLAQGLGAIAAQLPAGVQLLLSSRTGAPFPLARLAARGLVHQLGPEELRFTPDEVEELLARRAPAAGVLERWRKGVPGLDGWPLGLELLLSAKTASTAVLNTAGGPAMIAAYVVEEVLAALDEPTRAFALRAAQLPDFAVADCAWLPGVAAAEAIAALAARHVLEAPLGGRYRFPTYVREVLAAEGQREVPRPELDLLLCAVAERHLAAGQPEQALPLLVAAEAWEAAASACERAFPAMRFAGRHLQIQRWLEAMPPATRAEQPGLALWSGHMYSHAGAHADASAAYARARQQFAAGQDPAGAFAALVGELSIARVEGDQPRFTVLMAQAASTEAAGSPAALADLALIRALDHEQRGDLAGMRACNEEVLGYPASDDLEIASSHALAHMNLCTLALHQGGLARARRHVEQLSAIAQAHGFLALGLAASFLQAHLALLVRQVDEAARIVEALPPLWREVLHWHDLGVAYVVLGELAQRQGLLVEAEEAFTRAFDVFANARFDEGQKLAQEHLLWLAVQRRQLERVEALVSLAAAPAEGNVYDLTMWIPYARALQLRGEAARAAGLLQEVAAGLLRVGGHLAYTRALLYLAAARAAARELEPAREAYREACERMESYGHGFLAGHDQLLWEELAALSPAAPSPADAPTPPPLLALACFGPFEARVAGVTVDQWPRRKAKVLLAALALAPRGRSLGELAELMVEGDEDGLNLVRTTLVALRRSLEPSLAARAPSRFVTLADDRYLLEPGALGSVDVQRFEEAIAQGLALQAADPPAAAASFEAALAAYGGELLADPVFKRHFEVERVRCRRLASSAALWLHQRCLARNEQSRALNWLDRGLEISSCDEALYLTKIAFLVSLAAPDRARQAYWDCRRAYQAALGEAPSQEFEAEAARLFQGAGTPKRA